MEAEEIVLTGNRDLHVQEILLASSQHDLQTLEELIELYSFTDCKGADVQDNETRFSPLHSAIAACETEEEVDEEKSNGAAVGDGVETNGYSVEENGMRSREEEIEGAKKTIRCLLENGAIWNQLDRNGETPGCIAHRLGLTELYDLMVDAGVRAELLLSRLDEYERLEDEEENGTTPDREVNGHETTDESNVESTTSPEVNSQQFLSSTLSLSGDRLLDDQQNGVMMAWERDIMQQSADSILTRPGLKVLNIGFGMGIIDSYIQSHTRRPSTHHIVEAHPDVIAPMKAQGWHEKADVVIHEGKWQDVLPKLTAEGKTFDAIYFDTFAESYSDFRNFFSEHVIGLLEQEGRWSYFNGMGADRQISYDVYQKVVEMDLFEAGFDVEWKDIELPEMSREWEGVKKKYWAVDKYRIPTIRFMD